jgi:hypothetical protein
LTSPHLIAAFSAHGTRLYNDEARPM